MRLLIFEVCMFIGFELVFSDIVALGSECPVPCGAYASMSALCAFWRGACNGADMRMGEN